MAQIASDEVTSTGSERCRPTTASVTSVAKRSQVMIRVVGAMIVATPSADLTVQE